MVKPENVFYGQEGRGNNWAFGYHKDEGMNTQIMDAIRREAEQCDFYQGSFMLHSIGGGTGSGLGSKLMELYKDQFPSSSLINVVVWPHPKGETPLQNYNSCFTTAHLM